MNPGVDPPFADPAHEDPRTALRIDPRPRRLRGPRDHHPEHTIQWIAQLLDAKREHIPLRSRRDISVNWREVSVYRRKLEIEHTKITGEFLGVVNRLAAAGLIRPTNVKKPRITTHVKDMRLDSAEPLPEIKGVTVERFDVVRVAK